MQIFFRFCLVCNSAGYQHLLMGATDKRLGLVTEVINNIKVVKFFAWVSQFC
jgi:hypothetical protein